MTNTRYLVTDTPAKAILTFSIPIMLGNLFQQLYTMTDSVIVGRFVGENALASVGASYSLTSVFISIAIGGGMGASVVVSKAFGSADYKTMKQSISTSLFSFLLTSIILAVFGFIFSHPIMRALNTPGNILPEASAYLRIYFLGLPFLFMYNVLSSMFNALGKSKVPLYLLIFSSMLNVVLDIIMVGPMEMGVRGAGWATLISQGLSAIISFQILIRYLKSFGGTAASSYSGELAKRIWRIALPSILQQSTVSIGMMLVQSVVNSFGSEVLAGFSAAMRVESFVIVPMVAMGNSISTYTAQNLGAKQNERVIRGYRNAYLIVIISAALICIVLETCSDGIITLFLGKEGSQPAMATGTGYLTFMGWFFAFIGFKMITDGVLRGAGIMAVFTTANLVNLSIRVIIAFAAAPCFGIAAVWTAVPIGWIANWLISLWGYTKLRKKLTA
ncbi:MAG: MATE family efflux transporter [Spirochaetes bacterium]|uniref:Multidrug-efflux transporter n=1 Tax=Candidatus Ornithospirochaeta stercoripullorum TaxID=2840899 RepID=A0A9D9H5T1_9SPIO|nr:MATE family efflux transporter [Candidatus Ornithospirochaeta stercoripullorum]